MWNVNFLFAGYFSPPQRILTPCTIENQRNSIQSSIGWSSFQVVFLLCKEFIFLCKEAHFYMSLSTSFKNSEGSTDTIAHAECHLARNSPSPLSRLGNAESFLLLLQQPALMGTTFASTTISTEALNRKYHLLCYDKSLVVLIPLVKNSALIACGRVPLCARFSLHTSKINNIPCIWISICASEICTALAGAIHVEVYLSEIPRLVPTCMIITTPAD